MPPLRIAFGLVWLTACGFLNPLAETRDGTPPQSRLRIGISAATLDDDCSIPGACSVQLAMGHFDDRDHRIEIVAVRLVARGTDLGTLPTGAPLRWQSGAYRAWDRVLEPGRSTMVSIPIGRIEWASLLAPLDGEPDPFAQEYVFEIDLACDGEPLTVHSIFGIAAIPPRVFVVT
jgi:hypothetical protein